MKKIASLLLSLIMLLSLAACGGSGESQSSANSSTVSTSEESQETPEPEPTEAAGPQYEITYQNAKVWTDSIGSVWVQTIVEITNTGSTNLYLSSGAYDLEDADGNLVAAQSMVSAYPSVLAPGEKGYMYEETTLDNYTGDGNLTVIPRPDVEEATVDLIRYDTSDITVSNDEFSGVKVMGRVENTTGEVSEGMVYVVAFLYDANGTPIGSVFDILTEDLEVGSKVGFELTGLSLPDDITAESVASTTVYSYPLQYQF